MVVLNHLTTESCSAMESILSSTLSAPLRSPQQGPQRHPAKSKFLAAAVIVFALAGVAHGANIAISAVTINDETNGDRNIPGDVTSFEHASTLVDFTAGGTTYSNFVLVDAGGATGGYQWGFSATDPGSPGATVSDDRIDTSGFNVDETSEFEFASAPLDLSDLLFIFDLGGLDTAVEIQLIDAANNLLGNPESLSGMARIGSSSEVISNGNTPAFNGGAISFDEFGITSGQLSSVDGFRVTSGSSLDLNLAGHTGVASEPVAPEPSALAITEVEYDPVGDPGPTVTLTWTKTGAASYSVFYSFDLIDWGADLDDGVLLESDENPEDADQMTVTFPLVGPLENAPDAFFRVDGN